MKSIIHSHVRFCIAVLILSSIPIASYADDAAKLKRRPTEFAIILNLGYAGDHFPQDRAQFEKVIIAAKKAKYNVVLCKYEKWRENICKKHGLKLMVDLLVSGNHVYKDLAATEKLCTSLRGSDTIYAYHLWSDRVGGTVAGRSRDIGNVHKWDPNHATYIGDYKGSAIGGLKDPDLVGYYDFHWRRGGHWRHLLRARDAAKKTDSLFLKYTDGAPGMAGAGNYNRVLYTVSMSVACGLKGYFFHHTGAEIDKSTWEWKPLGQDLAKVNAEVAPLGPELMKIGNPSVVYSTPITKTAKDRPPGAVKPTVPAEFGAIPGDFWVKVNAGEAVMGVFKNAKADDALLFANHNAYQPQEMELEFVKPVKGAALFDRKAGKWTKLELDKGKVKFRIPPAAVELVLVNR